MSKPIILLIDYEPRSIKSISHPLEAGGYEVVTANDGLKGIETFKQVKPDAVLIEAMIPKKSGFEVCKHLRTIDHGRDVPIAILTAVYKGRKYRHEALHTYKCNEYLEKPLEPDVLLETVDRLVGMDRRAPSLPTESEILDHLDSILP